MFIGPIQSIVIAIVFMTFYTIDLKMISQFDHKRQSGTGRARNYTIMIFLAMMFVIIQPTIFRGLSFSTDAMYGLAIQICGIFLILLGMTINLWARRHLREFYAERVEIQPHHKIINTGPYAHVRHPIFTSFFLLIIGLFFVNPSLPLAIMVIYALTDFTRAALQEEKLLCQELSGYLDYMRTTSRFIPKLDIASGRK